MANGVYTNTELIETIIVDLNNLPKMLFDGQYIQFCTIVSQMGQKLINLRKTIDTDLKNREATIETLKQQLRATDCGVKEMTMEEYAKLQEKEGAENGSN